MLGQKAGASRVRHRARRRERAALRLRRRAGAARRLRPHGAAARRPARRRATAAGPRPRPTRSRAFPISATTSSSSSTRSSPRAARPARAPAPATWRGSSSSRPPTEIPQVRWRRNRITVRPDEGWQRDRVYRVELLPGVTDLRRNRLDRGALVTFSTGAPRPETTFEGTVVDWTSGASRAGRRWSSRPCCPTASPTAASPTPSGHFQPRAAPAGEYVVSGVLDENRNHLADPREAFDSVRVPRGPATARSSCGHSSTTPPLPESARSPRATACRPRSSSPSRSTRASGSSLSAVRVSLLPDSTPVRIASVLPRADRRQPPRRSSRPSVDSTAADTTAAAGHRSLRRPTGAPAARSAARPREKPLTSRPALTDQLVLRPVAPWRPGARYTVEMRGVRNVTGVAGDVVGTLVDPRALRARLAGGRPPTRSEREPTPSAAGVTRCRLQQGGLRQSRSPARRAPAKPAPTKPAPTRSQ